MSVTPAAATPNQGQRMAQSVANVDMVPSPTATPTVQNTPDPTPTPDPVKTMTISWNSAPSTIYTVGTANVRNIPFTSGYVIKTLAAAQTLTVYGTVNGEILSNGALWYRISDQNSTPEYIYSELVSTTKPVPVVTTGPTATPGKIIKVNLTAQTISAYDNGTLVHQNLITSGQPNLLTPTGTFQIISKLHPATFYSPWPKGSPYYYAPLNINYALGFQGTLLFLHDATWRGTDFGPGTNVPHTAANGSQMTGSHGCVEMSVDNSAWFYNWATIGTPLVIAY
ncbi:L,D-transpeptidase family protein [Dictyobacter kobayashii]|uniref:L,D-transpeptidase family protein n=1 Tax=Dictyobacter kobayashii TaxID=2014872 RepID=UPI001386F2B0|nr:L,D-transpeptidase family protein [Dictyobacter kobayashii]